MSLFMVKQILQLTLEIEALDEDDARKRAKYYYITDWGTEEQIGEYEITKIKVPSAK